VKRALLIWNPVATTTTPGVRDVIARALSSELHVELAETTKRGHATDLAAEAAAADAFDLVCVLGGDGTINEAVNGLAGTGIPLATIPGGGTNVLARTLGYPKDSVEATAMLLSRVREGLAPRTVNLGRVNGRAFAFCAGVGFDAEVVRRVEANPRAKRRFGETFFISSGLREYFFPSSRPRPALELTGPDGKITDGIRAAIVGNSNPYTFLGSRPFRVVPEARLDLGLDLTALRTMRITTVLRVIFSAFGPARHVRFRAVTTLHDADSFVLRADAPARFQVDGDLAGSDTEFRFSVERGALRVIG